MGSLGELAGELKAMFVSDLKRIAELEAALRDKEHWRPIDTAPKDTRVLVCLGLDDGTKWVAISAYLTDPENEGWCDSEFMASYYRKPLGWMPLPEPMT